MARTKGSLVRGDQITLVIPKGWKEELEQLAREKAFKEKRDISFSDLIREAIMNTYNLSK